MAGQIRFGVVNEMPSSGRLWIDHVRRIEDGGIDVFLVRDHLSASALGPQWAPFSALATAAASTDRLRVGTMVLANDFRHPAVVAQEAATLADLSGGRFELGMGAGWFEPEFRAAGLAFDLPRTRIARLQESVHVIKSLLAGETVRFEGEHYSIAGLSLDLRPAQPPPLLIGGGGPKMLAFAARVADVIGVLPAPIRSPDDAESAADRLPEAFDRKVEVVRREAGPQRFAELEICAFVTIQITDRKREATERLIQERGWSGVTAEDVWTMPTIFIGSRDEIRDLLRERRERFALSYLVTGDRDLETVSNVAKGL
ncbi:MAG: TIGR03621 family F420-dependent LLM class oxidoreductase [Actinomycetota bacterium]